MGAETTQIIYNLIKEDVEAEAPLIERLFGETNIPESIEDNLRKLNLIVVGQNEAFVCFRGDPFFPGDLELLHLGMKKDLRGTIRGGKLLKELKDKLFKAAKGGKIRHVVWKISPQKIDWCLRLGFEVYDTDQDKVYLVKEETI